MEQDLLKRLELLEQEVQRQAYYTDMQEIEQVKSRYVYLMENNQPENVWEELFVHDDPDVSMELNDNGKYIGPEHVKRAWYTIGGVVDENGNPQEKKMFEGQKLPFMMLTVDTPYIVVAKDRKTAKGDWHIFGPHTVNMKDPDTGDMKMCPYWFAGKFHHEFVKTADGWKFKHFRAISWMRAPYEGGWMKEGGYRKSNPPFAPDEPPRYSFYDKNLDYQEDFWGPMPDPIIKY